VFDLVLPLPRRRTATRVRAIDDGSKPADVVRTG
jgi:hypothetical protein